MILFRTYLPVHETQDAAGRVAYHTDDFEPPVVGARLTFAMWPDGLTHAGTTNPQPYVTCNWEVASTPAEWKQAINRRRNAEGIRVPRGRKRRDR
jgi:hypothetical protein